MNVAPNVNFKRTEELETKLLGQLNKCLNENNIKQEESRYLDELADLLSASTSDMTSLSVKPDKCAILAETVNHICRINKAECAPSDDLQKSEVSSSKPTILANDILGPLLLEALDGFLFIVNTDGKIEFVSANITSFLKYRQDEIVETSIYNIIHVNDHARFSSNLLPMSIGNGFCWSSEPNATISKSRSFNCRLLIKSLDDQETTMEEKQTRVPQYENMQISAVLFPLPSEKTDSPEIDSELQNRLVCVARRIPPNEKTPSAGVEQFTTRLDLTGKILAVDTSGASSTYSQYLNKDIVGHIILELCHQNDLHRLNHHLKETLQTGSDTSGIYRLRVAQEKYIHVQTKSKRVNYNQLPNEYFIMATHSIISRESDPSLEGNSSFSVQRSNSTVNTSAASHMGSNVNGNSYPFPSLSPQDFSLGDIGLDIFPTSSWDLGDSGSSGIPTTSFGGPLTPISSSNTSAGTSAVSRVQQMSSNAFSPDLMSGRGSPATHSPAQLSSTSSPAPGRITPFSNTFAFSPISTQPTSGTVSPIPANILAKRNEELPPTNSELSSLSPMTELVHDGQVVSSATEKLRNLLTQGMEDEDSVTSKVKLVDNTDVSNPNNAESENRCGSAGIVDSMPSRNENIILMKLLNQEDEDLASVTYRSDPNELHVNPSDICKRDSSLSRTINNNDMLRKLLNSEDEERKFCRSRDVLIQQLLKAESPSKSDSMGLQDDNLATENQKSTNDSFLKQLGLGPSHSGAPNIPVSLVDVIDTTTKRKSPEISCEEPVRKRHTQLIPHAHLAGQNPMLASMLARTPRTAPSVPTSIAKSIVSQLPQERLPGNLEKKLVHTPFAGATTSGSITSPNNQYVYTQSQGQTAVLSASLQQEIVTADSRGHITLAQHSARITTFPNAQGFLGKILASEGGQLADLQSANTYGQYTQPPSVQQHSLRLTTGICDPSSTEDACSSALPEASDPFLESIMDEVWSLEDELNLEAPSDNSDLVKLFVNDISETPPASSPHPVVSAPQDLNEKMAINAIQRQLMSFEIPAGRNSPFSQSAAATPQLPQLPLPSGSLAGFSASHFQAAPPAYTSATVLPTQEARHLVAHPANSATIISNSQQLVSMGVAQRINLQQYPNASMNAQTRRIYERRQKFILSQQKRLQIQQRQLSMQTQQSVTEHMATANPSTFSENMSDLLNNTVAPNVTLQPANVQEQQLSPRYSSAMVNQLPSPVGQPSAAPPSQLSPSQRQQQPPYSPISQQSFPSPNSYQPSRLSPHSYPQGSPSPRLSPQSGSSQSPWVQRPSLATNPANLQQQNPMLNAQLSQGSYVGQARFPAQRHLVVNRSMPSPNSRNSPFAGKPESPYSPLSPIYQQQQQQQPPPPQHQQVRMQRTAPVQGQVNSSRPLQAGFVSGESLLPSQQSPGAYNQPSTQVSTFGSGIPINTPTYSQDGFTFDQHPYPPTTSDRNRGPSGGMTSKFVRQELRAMVGARTQQQHQQQIQVSQPQNLHQLSCIGNSQMSSAVPTSQPLSHVDLDALSLSLDLGSEGQPSSPALYTHSLLSVTSGQDIQSQNSPRIEEIRPMEQKKSLLQQLLSEPP